jgi:Bacteriocin-protection, YdeI or OmpD-Associated/Domain of unknown function (DUF1905)
MRVTLELQPTGGATAGYQVPDEVVEQLGSTRRPRVRVTVNGLTFRTTIAPMGGQYWLGVSRERREAAGIAAGETHELELELDTEAREVEVPADLAAAVAADPAAAAFWETLSYSNQRYHAEQVTGAKKPETRARRVARSVEMLREGRAR